MAWSRDSSEGLRKEPAPISDETVSPGGARALAPRRELEGPERPGARDPNRAVAGASAAVLACAPVLAFAPSRFQDGSLLPIAALAAAFTSAPLVVRGDALAPPAAALRAVGRVTFYLVAFALSFAPIADALRFRSATSPGLLAALPPLLLALCAIVLSLRRHEVEARARGEAILVTTAVLAFAAGLLLETGVGVAVAANLALAFLAAGRIVRGVSSMARGAFWEGLLVAAVVAGSRVAEVPLEGWPRATSAFLVAAGTTAAGLLFERRRTREPHEAPAHAP